MKKFTSIVLAVCFVLSSMIIVSSSEAITAGMGITASISGNTEYSQDEVTVSNIDTLKSVAKITVDNQCAYYKAHSSDAETILYVKDGSNIQKVTDETTITSSELYVHTTEPGKSTIFVVGYTDDVAVGSQTFNIECSYVDSREKVGLEKLYVGGEEITGFSSEVFDYTYNCESLDDDLAVTYRKQNEEDTVEVIQNKNSVSLLVCNRDKSKTSVYTIDFKYSFVSNLNVTIAESADTDSVLEYSCTYAGEDVTDLCCVAVPAESGYVKEDGQIYTVKPGEVSIVFSLGTVAVTKTVTFVGELVIDVPQFDLTLRDTSKFDIGDIINIKYDSSVFRNDTRIITTSSNESVAKVVGNKLVVIGAGNTRLEVTHPILGEVLKRDITVENPKDTKYNVIPKVSDINMPATSSKVIDLKLENTYDRTVTYSVESGSSVEIYGNTIKALKLGDSVIKIESGNAERTVKVKVVSLDTVIPTGIVATNASSAFVLNKESIINVEVLPEGATVADKDISITSDKEIYVRSVGNFNFGVTPKAAGEHNITVSINKFNMKTTIKLTADAKGDVETPEGSVVDVEKITLEDSYISVEVGYTKTISVRNITPANATNKEVRYESQNTRIATVDENGKVKGIRAGTAKINVYSVSNPKIYAVCSVNVYDDDDRGSSNSSKYRYPVDKVEIYKEENGKEVRIRNDKTEVMNNTEQQFIARISPYNATNKDVRWYTSNSSVADVDDDGVLTAYREGEVTLSVVTEDGNKRDSIKVEITEWMLKPKSIKIVNSDNTPVNTNVKTGDKVSLKIEFEPMLTTERDVRWVNMDNKGLLTLGKNGDIEFKEVGQATIKVYTKDYSTSAEVTFNITYSDTYWSEDIRFPYQRNVNPKKGIDIKFSEPISSDNLENGNIFVSSTKDGNKPINDVVLSLEDGGSTVRVKSSKEQWDGGKVYYLMIKGTTLNSRGVKLDKNFRYTFETRKESGKK